MAGIKLRDIIKSETIKLVSVPPSVSLKDAAHELSAHRVGTVVVADDQGEPIGILSERDVTRAFAEHGADAVKLTVADYMSTNVVLCDEKEEPHTAVWLMHEYGIRHLPITANGRIRAVVSSRDVLRYLSNHGSPEEQSSLWQTKPSSFES